MHVLCENCKNRNRWQTKSWVSPQNSESICDECESIIAKENELQSKFYWKEFVTIEFQCATCDWSETWCPTHFFQTKYGNIGLKRKSDEKNENPERKRQRIY